MEVAGPLDAVAAPRTSSRRLIVASLAARLSVVGTLVVVGVSLLVWGGRGFPDQPMSFLHGPLGFGELAVIALVFVGIGGFLVTRLPGHAIGWSLVVIGVGVALHMPANLAVEGAVSSFRPVSSALLVSVWALGSAFVPLAVGLIAFLLMILPDGRLQSRRWLSAAIAAILGFLVLTIATALEPSGLLWFPTLPNPLDIPESAATAVHWGKSAGVALLAAGLALAAMSMVHRYRWGDEQTRRQLRWVAAGAVVWAITLVPFLVVRYLTRPSDELGSAVTIVAAAGTLSIPIAIFIATARDHLFGIEGIVGRTLVYVPLMAICGGLYAAGLALMQRLFVALTGNTSDVAIVFATLIMAAGITPVRRLLEATVERLVASPHASAAKPDLGEADEMQREYEQLRVQSAALAARMAEVEQQITALPSRRDLTRDLGEPGVGRQVLAVASDAPSPDGA